MTEHILHRQLPLILKASRQLVCLLRRRLMISPHRRLRSLGRSEGCNQVTTDSISKYILNKWNRMKRKEKGKSWEGKEKQK